jgi:hypothetical protein
LDGQNAKIEIIAEILMQTCKGVNIQLWLWQRRRLIGFEPYASCYQKACERLEGCSAEIPGGEDIEHCLLRRVTLCASACLSKLYGAKNICVMPNVFRRLPENLEIERITRQYEDFYAAL